MLSLMTADILYGTLVMPLSAVLCSSASQSILAAMPYLPNVVMFYSRWIVTVGINSLSWVTLCKMIAITKPFVYERHLNTTRCYVIIAFIWTIGFLIGLACFRVETYWNTSVCMPRLNHSSAVDAVTDLTFIVCAVSPIILIVFGTTKIFMVIVRTHQQITSQVQSMGGAQDAGGETTSTTLQSIRSGRNVLIICASIVLLLIPVFAYDVYASVSGKTDEVYLINFFVMWTGAWNTVVNSILFLILYRYVREKTIEMLKGMCVCIN